MQNSNAVEIQNMIKKSQRIYFLILKHQEKICDSCRGVEQHNQELLSDARNRAHDAGKINSEIYKHFKNSDLNNLLESEVLHTKYFITRLHELLVRAAKDVFITDTVFKNRGGYLRDKILPRFDKNIDIAHRRTIASCAEFEYRTLHSHCARKR